MSTLSAMFRQLSRFALFSRTNSYGVVRSMADVDVEDNEPFDMTTGDHETALTGAESPDDFGTREEEEQAYEVINGIPMYQKGHVLDNRCQIYERIGWDDRVGATYLATAPDGKELVVRIGNEHILIPQLEASFLSKVEQQNLWRLFSQIHSIWHQEKFYFLALYFRSGPQLSQCMAHCGNRFSHGTAARLALDILKILRAIHGLGYLIRAIDPEMFHFDACSRHLFLADLSTIRKDTSKVDVQRHELIMPHWCGGLLFAPMTYHDEDPISCRDELEAWLYLFLYFVKGTLPWEKDRYDDVKWTKIQTINCGELFQGLPLQYHELLDVITSKSSVDPVSELEYEKLQQITFEIFHDIGGITDDDQNLDFERDPREDEIPRIIMERRASDFKELAEEHTQSSSSEDQEDTAIQCKDESI
ncbi:unnamed protein product [Cylicocyclus nassatus]|uniref:Protein kinase domain-containing protein n=1 Tax=Cylicocyclus nassatus TaxID=53992 RepID=A0AA36HAM9_CYLNA|nr:unnamed protein product [Cylicocyclus nassatus]